MFYSSDAPLAPLKNPQRYLVAWEYNITDSEWLDIIGEEIRRTNASCDDATYIVVCFDSRLHSCEEFMRKLGIAPCKITFVTCAGVLKYRSIHETYSSRADAEMSTRGRYDRVICGPRGIFLTRLLGKK